MIEVRERTKVLWFSRHEMTASQIMDLERIFGKVNIHQVSRTIQHAIELKREIHENDVIAIVAPLPLQQEFLELAGGKPVIFCKNKRILDGDGGKVRFIFDGWFKIKKIDVVIESL